MDKAKFIVFLAFFSLAMGTYLSLFAYKQANVYKVKAGCDPITEGCPHTEGTERLVLRAYQEPVLNEPFVRGENKKENSGSGDCAGGQLGVTLKDNSGCGNSNNQNQQKPAVKKVNPGQKTDPALEQYRQYCKQEVEKMFGPGNDCYCYLDELHQVTCVRIQK